MLESNTHSPASASSRSLSPESQLTNSLCRANATIDELTSTLAKISRASTDDGSNLQCCCGRHSCDNSKAWTAFQNKLEGTTEVGQALLEKHEAYVRRHGSDEPDNDCDMPLTQPRTHNVVRCSLQEHQNLEANIQDLKRESASLEKRLAAALLNAEMAESSKCASLQELSDAREALSRLSLSQAKATGWEIRLNTTQEKEDLQQELFSERQKLRGAEAHVLALKERSLKQQSELARLHDELEQLKHSRAELSGEILRDARARLQMVQQQQLGRTIACENSEVTQVMESLVADNEALKRDIAELQNLLVEAREDVRVLREEVEECQATSDDQRHPLSTTRFAHAHTSSWASSFGRGQPASRSRGISTQPYEPLTPRTDALLLSPPRGRMHLPGERTSRPECSSSLADSDIEERKPLGDCPDSTGKRSPMRPLFLLSHGKAIQTDDINWSNLLGSANQRPFTDEGSSIPTGGSRSDASSFVDALNTPTSTIAILVDRTGDLFARMTQADAHTLTHRLRRQRLTGDVSHLSHATVSAIINDASALRSHFRGVLEDERSTATCSRRDLRALLSLLKEIFAELGQMRMTLNDIILDPSLANYLSEAAMYPSKTLNEARSRASARLAGNWLFSKLFGGANSMLESPAVTSSGKNCTQTDSALAHATVRQRSSKVALKSSAALSASTTVVNVEFTGAGTGRSLPNAQATASPNVNGLSTGRISTTPESLTTRSVMGIFAGAPQSPVNDSWVILSDSRLQTKLKPAVSTMDLRTATLTRSAGKRTGRGPSRTVDAIVDSTSALADSDPEDGDNKASAPLLERTLRNRGLSDSSLRSSYLEASERLDSPTTSAHLHGRFPHNVQPTGYSGTIEPRTSLRAFSKAFANPVHLSSSVKGDSVRAPSPLPRKADRSPIRGTSSVQRPQLLPSLAQWAVQQAGLDVASAEHFVGSFKERQDESQSGKFDRRAPWHNRHMDVRGRDI